MNPEQFLTGLKFAKSCFSETPNGPKQQNVSRNSDAPKGRGAGNVQIFRKRDHSQGAAQNVHVHAKATLSSLAMAGTAGRKSVLITGCSDGGLGAAMAREFAARGFHVFATVRSTAKAASLAADPADGKTGSEWIELLELDVASTTAIRACAETVAARTGGTLDVLVNNAGCSLWMPLLDADLEASRRVFDVNVWGMLAVAQAFGPMLVRAKGAMLNICSIAGAVRMAWQGQATECATRWRI